MANGNGTLIRLDGVIGCHPPGIQLKAEERDWNRVVKIMTAAVESA